ncbi:MAG: hypothetical protein AAB516_01920 [Patescibacteria group bacterium]
MTNFKLKFKNFIFYIVILIFTFLFLHFAVAASPQFLTSWQSNSYVPSWYQGKIFPTRGSLINVSFEIINNDKIADISKNKIRWYINDKLIKNENNGLGIRSLKFINDDFPGGEISVKIAVVDYAAEPLYKIIRIPVVSPEAVIDAPYAERKINTGKNLFRVFPFFFNIKNLNSLSFEWQANEQTSEAAENPQELNLNIDLQTPSRTVINIAAIIKNISNQLEFASKNIKLEVK